MTIEQCKRLRALLGDATGEMTLAELAARLKRRVS